MAKFGYIECLKSTWACFNDAVELERAGFTVCFTDAITTLPRKDLDSMLRYESCQSTKLFRLVQRIWSQVLGYFAEYSDNYPGKLAPLGGTAEDASEALDGFKMDVKAYHRAQDSSI